MELEKRIVRIEKVSAQMMSAGGTFLSRLTLFIFAAYGFAKFLKYLVATW